MKVLSFKFLKAAALAIFYRFPWVITCAVLGAIFMILAIENDWQSTSLNKMICIFELAIPLLLSIRLYLEQYTPKQREKKYYLYIIALMILLMFWASLPPILYFIHYQKVGLWFLVLHLCISFTPFFWKNDLQSFWRYNYFLFTRFFISFFYALILFVGSATAILAIDRLFVLQVENELYQEWAVVVFGVFSLAFFLAELPENLSVWENPPPLSLKHFVEYILIPVMVVYWVILCVYAFKIILYWDLPEGLVSDLVITFSALGIFILLLLYPFKEEDVWINKAYSWFFVLLLPLLLLLFVAIIRRIQDYGVTESRYWLVVVALWLLGISFYFLLSKQKNIRYIPMSLACVLWLSSVGFWGAFKVAEQSQLKRFHNLLTKNKFLKKGKISIPDALHKHLSPQDITELIAITDFLGSRGRLVKLQPYFQENLDSLLKDMVTREAKQEQLLSLIGHPELLKEMSQQTYLKTINFSVAQMDDVQNIKGYDYMLKFEYYGLQSQNKVYQLEDRALYLEADFLNHTLQLVNAQNKQPMVTFRLDVLMQNLVERYLNKPYQVLPAYMSMLEESEYFQAKIQLSNLSLVRKTKKQNTFTGLSGQIMLKFY
jgi:hypothetical protein